MVTSAVEKADADARKSYAKAHAMVAKAKPKDKAAAQVKAEKATTAGTTNALKAGGKADVKAANTLSFLKIPEKLKKSEKVSVRQ